MKMESIFNLLTLFLQKAEVFTPECFRTKSLPFIKNGVLAGDAAAASLVMEIDSIEQHYTALGEVQAPDPDPDRQREIAIQNRQLLFHRYLLLFRLALLWLNYEINRLKLGLQEGRVANDGEGQENKIHYLKRNIELCISKKANDLICNSLHKRNLLPVDQYGSEALESLVNTVLENYDQLKQLKIDNYSFVMNHPLQGARACREADQRSFKHKANRLKLIRSRSIERKNTDTTFGDYVLPVLQILIERCVKNPPPQHFTDSLATYTAEYWADELEAFTERHYLWNKKSDPMRVLTVKEIATLFREADSKLEKTIVTNIFDERLDLLTSLSSKKLLALLAYGCKDISLANNTQGTPLIVEFFLTHPSLIKKLPPYWQDQLNRKELTPSDFNVDSFKVLRDFCDSPLNEEYGAKYAENIDYIMGYMLGVKGRFGIMKKPSCDQFIGLIQMDHKGLYVEQLLNSGKFLQGSWSQKVDLYPERYLEVLTALFENYRRAVDQNDNDAQKRLQKALTLFMEPHGKLARKKDFLKRFMKGTKAVANGDAFEQSIKHFVSAYNAILELQSVSADPQNQGQQAAAHPPQAPFFLDTLLEKQRSFMSWANRAQQSYPEPVDVLQVAFQDELEKKYPALVTKRALLTDLYREAIRKLFSTPDHELTEREIAFRALLIARTESADLTPFDRQILEFIAQEKRTHPAREELERLGSSPAHARRSVAASPPHAGEEGPDEVDVDVLEQTRRSAASPPHADEEGPDEVDVDVLEQTRRSAASPPHADEEGPDEVDVDVLEQIDVSPRVERRAAENALFTANPLPSSVPNSTRNFRFLIPPPSEGSVGVSSNPSNDENTHSLIDTSSSHHSSAGSGPAADACAEAELVEDHEEEVTSGQSVHSL